MKGRDGDPQELDHLGGARDHAAARGQGLGERRHPQIHVGLDAEELAGACAARAEHAEAVGLVDHQPRAVLLAERDDLRQRGDIALHRVDAVDHDEDAAAVLLRLRELLLEQVEPVVTEWPHLRA